MLCPKCRFENFENDQICRRCGLNLSAKSTSLVRVHNNTPALLRHPQLPRFAAGVGVVAVGVGIELMRRGLLARMMPSPKLPGPQQPVVNSLPALNGLRDVLFPQNDKKISLPKNYELEETVVYIRRVIRRKN
ncbi:MAG TPA: hypothetical protein VKP04_07250 [Ktedonobacteraceae bacterium]|nr:hypothetical protein [Ktedonobacteraceae bacterium]